MARTMSFVLDIGARLGRGFTSAFSSASSVMSRMQNNIRDTRTNIRTLESAYRTGIISVASYENGHRQLTRTLEREQNAQRRLGNAMNREQNISNRRQNFRDNMWDTAELAMTIAIPVKYSMDMESSMADVKKVVDFETPQQFKEMEKDIVGLSKVIPMAASDLAKIVAAGGQSGIAREDLVSFAESAAKMGVAFDITADQAGDMMAKWRTAFKMDQSGVVELADKINYLSNKTAASAPLISEVVTRVGPLGDIGGVASSEIAALGASMVGVGVPAEVAATGIKNMILGMAAGEGATKSQAAAFAELGMNTTDVAKRMQVDAKGAILDVFKSLQSLDKDKQAFILSDLFGKESISAIAPLLSSIDNMQNNFDMVSDKSKYAGSMQAEFAARIETTEAKLQLAKNAAISVAMAIGDYLLPYIQIGAEWFGKAATAFEGFSAKYPELVKWTTIGVAGFFALTIAVSAIGYAILGLAYPFTKLMTFYQAHSIATWGATIRTYALAAAQKVSAVASKISAGAQWAWNIAMTAGRALLGIGRMVIYYGAMAVGKAITVGMTIAQWAWNAAMTANPIGLVIAGIVALVGVGVWMWKNWDDIGQWLAVLWDNPLVAVETFTAAIKTKFSGTFSWLEEKWTWVCSLFNDSKPANDIMASQSQNYGDVDMIDIPQNYGAMDMIDIPQNSRGGIYGKGAFLTTFAEEGPEAAIPLDGSPRAIGLWQQAGQALGMGENIDGSSIVNRNIGDKVSNNISISAPLTITINGNADNSTVQEIKQVVDDSLATLERKINALQSQKARISYA